jgi:hypothetical protein
MTVQDFTKIRDMRMQLRDPAGVNDIIIVDALPVNPDPNSAYYVNPDGNYKKYNSFTQGWDALALRLSDAYILEMIEQHKNGAILYLIDFLIAGLKTGAVSFNAGAESVSFPSLADLLNYYTQLRALKQEEIAAENGNNTGRMFRTRRPPIGGVVEADYGRFAY